MQATDLESGVSAGRILARGPLPKAHLEAKATHLPDSTDDLKEKGYFITRNGKSFAGSHLIIDLRNATNLDDVEHIEEALTEAVNVAGATLLHIHLHHFSPCGGVSGVAVLAESHISIHTWPEYGFAALDVFMCGKCKPEDTIPVLQRAFSPESIDVQEIMRGEVRECPSGGLSAA